MTEYETNLNLPPAERQKMSKILSNLTPEQIQYSIKWFADQNYLKRDVEFEKHYEEIEKNLRLLAETALLTQSSIETTNKELLKDVDEKIIELGLVVKDKTDRLSDSFKKIENIDRHMHDSQNTIEKLTDKIHAFMHDKVSLVVLGIFFVVGVLFNYFMESVLFQLSTKIGIAPLWIHFIWVVTLGFLLGMFLRSYFYKLSDY
jgi:hypothetical protein